MDIGTGHRRRNDTPSVKDWFDLNEPGHQAAAASFALCALISLAVLVSGATFYASGAAGGEDDSPTTEPVTATAPNATDATEAPQPQRRIGEVTWNNEDGRIVSSGDQVPTWDDDLRKSVHET
ncbi:hypothetical protein V5799_009986 [Amblyomma americanum]|uniref:Uncharacterized protein n=1 Tax=Amblyomma americanum TaxID=6943 RepID=A0AAQ4F9D1_AMBAM